MQRFGDDIPPPTSSMLAREEELLRLQQELRRMQQQPPRAAAAAAAMMARPEVPPPPTTGQYLINELRIHVPFLSASFSCSDDDAIAILTAISSARGTSRGPDVAGGHHLAGSDYRLEDKLAGLEAEVRTLTQRLDRRTEECDRLRDEVSEARQKVRAIETSTKQTSAVLSQRREEMRKQLLTEEGRTTKLQFQNKVLQQEVDKLKGKLHTALR